PPLSSMGQVAISCRQAVGLGPAEPAPEGQAGRRGPMTRVLVALAILVTLAGVTLAGPAGAESLRSTGRQSIRHIYRTAPSLVGLGGLAGNGAYQNAADAILEQAIRNLPLFPGASSAYTYRWNDERGEIERVDDSVSPFFLTERAQTLGERLINVGVTF